MAFTVRDFHDLVELLEQHPTWRAEVRRLVLTDEILKLPQELRELAQIVRELSETSRRNEARFVRIERDIDEVKTDVGIVKTDMTVVKSDVADLKTDMTVVKSDVADLKTDMTVVKSDIAELKTDVGVLKTDVAVLKTDVAQLKGNDLERLVRERPFVYFSRFARRLRIISDAELGDLVEAAVQQNQLTEAEADQIKLLDAIARGLHRETNDPLYLAAEVSSVVDEHDLKRAVARAALLQKATGVLTLPIVVGKTIRNEVRAQAEAQSAGWVQLPA
jgi:chromosome segregation ATPase